MKLRALIALSAFLLLPTASADCQSDYDAAMALIRKAKGQALADKPVDKSFDRELNLVINSLANQGCAFEIMEIVRFQETERNLPSNPLSP